MITYQLIWRIFLATLMLAVLAACGTAAELNSSNLNQESENKSPGTINGQIGFQAPPTGDTILYALSVDDPSISFSTGVPGSDTGPSAFSIEVAPGTYQLFAYLLSGVNAAAYLDGGDGSLGSVVVGSGESVAGISLVFSYPQVPCQALSLPASPDGLFPVVEGNPGCFEAMTGGVEAALAVVNGRIGFQGPPTPPTVVYFVDQSMGEFYVFEVPGSDAIGEFSVEVPAGNYQVWGWMENGGMAAAFDGLEILSLAAGETVEITLTNAIGVPCQYIGIPASPDGRFPALEVNTACIDQFATLAAESTLEAAAETAAPATISGTIGYQGPPTPTSILYLLNPYTGQWYWVEILGGNATIPFSITVEPGTYLLFAHQSDGAGSQAAAFMETDGTIAEVVLRPGQYLDGVTLTFAYPTSPCQLTYFPASPDGRFPEISATCP